MLDGGNNSLERRNRMLITILLLLLTLFLVIGIPIIIGVKTIRSGERSWNKVRDNMAMGASFSGAIVSLGLMYTTKAFVLPLLFATLSVVAITFICQKILDLRNQWTWKYPMI